MNEPAPATPVSVPSRYGFLTSVSIAWIAPLIALVITLSVAYRTLSERGPVIEILFESATGIKPGETRLLFRDLPVGLVEKIKFTDDLSQIRVQVRLDKEIAEFVDSDASFWLVSARVGPGGISGLETVLTGSYIAGFWDENKGPRQSTYTALDDVPLIQANQPGQHIRIRAEKGGSVAVGAPVMFRQVQVGTVESVKLSEAGDIDIQVFVEAPHHTRMTSMTRFWNASGFSFELGAGGASLNVESIAALIKGGISFDTVVSGGDPVDENTTFQLYDSENSARSSVLNSTDSAFPVFLTAVFEGSVEGLESGARVLYRGIPVGEVTALQARVVAAAGGPQVRLDTSFTILPARLGINDDENSIDAALDVLESGVQRGLRAKLSSTGLLGNKLHIELTEIPDAEPAEINRDAKPFPSIPTVATDTSDIVKSAENVMKRVSELPIEDIMQSIVTLLANANNLLTDEDLKAVPANVGQMVADLREIVSDSELKAAPGELSAILTGIRTIVDQAAEAQIVAQLSGALEDARVTIRDIGTASEGLPAVLEGVNGLTGQVRDLPLNDLVAAATGLVQNVDAFVQSDDVTGLPGEVDAAVAEVRQILGELQTGGAAGNANAVLASMRQVADELAAAKITTQINATLSQAEAAMNNVNTASADLPELLDAITDLSNRAAELPYEELLAAGTRLINTSDELLGSDEFANLPPRLSDALHELERLLAELREGGAVKNVNATLASADEAAMAITLAARELPALVANFNQVARRADAALANVGPDSELNRETVVLLNEVREAARSVNSLANALERRPNSVLFGR